MRVVSWGSVVLAAAGAGLIASPANAQGEPPPPAAPPPDPTYGEPPPNQGYGQPPPNQGYGQPPPNQGYGQPPPAGPSDAYQQGYEQGRREGYDSARGGYGEPAGGRGYSEPPPPPAPEREEGGGGKIPPFSIRVDPLNWILEGRLALELEMGLISFMTVELVPVFVTAGQPPTFNYVSSYGGTLRQESNGIGPMSGASIGLGFWLEGKPLEGNVIRAIFQNYGYTYRSDIDSVTHTERVLMGMFGSVSRWGAFTFGAGIGLGIDLNDQERCVIPDCGSVQVRDRNGRVVDVLSDIHPAVFDVRLSLGVTID